MKELETRIIQDGKIINNEILKIDSFINHQIDVNLLNNISKYLSSHFANITKILTIETSGIAYFAIVYQSNKKQNQKLLMKKIFIQLEFIHLLKMLIM